MKLECEVEISCYLHKSGKLGRAFRALLTVGHHPVGNANGNCQSKYKQMFLLVRSSNQWNGLKFKVSGNIVNLFTRFKDDGKATIRFKEPPRDIMIKKADPLQLKSFLLFVTLGKNEKIPENLHLTNIAAHTGGSLARRETKLNISSLSEYPLSRDFPLHLVVLTVNDCDLKKIDPRIFNLKNLRILDLNTNSISGVPRQIERLTKLKEINLSHNQLKCFPMALCSKTMRFNLQSINLDHNQIEYLPKEICFFTKLSKLSLSHNLLTQLPVCIGNLNNLRELRIPYNNIKIFPSSIVCLSLSFFDISGNPLTREMPSLDPNRKMPVPSLLEQSCRKIYKQRILFTDEDVPETLCDHMRCYGLCCCGNPVFRDGTFCYVWLSLQHVSHTIQFINGDLRFNFPMQRILCSPFCMKRKLSRR